MKLIPLTQGRFAKVSDADFERLSAYNWSVNGDGYAVRRGGSMHRLLLPHAAEVDHINGDKLDNQRSNLRECTHSENGKNRLPNRSARSPYKGVDWQNKTSTWRARIKVNYKSIYLGDFKTEKEAAIAYNEAAVKYHKQFARLNEVTQ